VTLASLSSLEHHRPVRCAADVYDDDKRRALWQACERICGFEEGAFLAL